MQAIPHDSWSAIYDQLYKEEYVGLLDALTDRTLEWVHKTVPAGSHVLDVGAGTGRLSIPLAEAGYRVTAIDSSAGMLRELRAKDPEERITCVTTPVESFSTADRFDAVLAVFTVLIYLTSERALSDAFRTLASCIKPNGVLLIDVPSKAVFQSHQHFSTAFDRTVEITPQGGNLFLYQEDVTAHTSTGEQTFNDEFLIRNWTKEEVLSVAESHGFREPRELAGFAGSGSCYIQLVASESAPANLRHNDGTHGKEIKHE